MDSGLLLAAVSLLAAVTAAGVTAYAWRLREEPGARWFAVLMSGVVVWSGSYGLALLVMAPDLRVLLEVPIELGKAIIAPAWLLFALRYTGRGEAITRPRLAALAVVPVATLGIVATNTSHGLMWTNYRIEPFLGSATVLYDPGVWHYVHAVFGWLTIGLGMAFLLGAVVSFSTLYRNQTIALAVGAGIPFLTHIKRTFMLGPVPQLNLTPLALAGTGVLFGVALFRFELLGLIPATGALGRQAAIDDVGVGVVVVDDAGRVIEFNDAATILFEQSAETVLQKQLTELIEGIDLTEESQRIERMDSEGRRTYDVTVNDVRDRTDRIVGRTVTFTDITDQERRRQQLEVLNRILRHNLRNELTVVMGRAELLANRLTDERPDDAAMAEVIEERAGALATLGEKARRIEALTEEADERHRVDIETLIETVADRYRGSNETTIIVDGECPTILSNRAVLEAALDNLVENAVEHAGDQPQVRIVTRYETGVATVAVMDDGPGIPEHELDAISAGGETPLQHGSGIGLWLVNWATDALGAELSFDIDTTGTTVKIRLPAEPGTEAAVSRSPRNRMRADGRGQSYGSS